MLKKLSENKSQIIVMLLIAAVVIARNLVTCFSKGKPSEYILFYCIVMSLLYVFIYFRRIPSNRADLFTGRNLVGSVSALAIFVYAFERYYIMPDFCFAMVTLFVMIICASDIRLMPVNVIAVLALSISERASAAFTSIPFAIAISFAVVFPAIKGAELWKKLVFAATQISTAAMLGYNIYQLRFKFSFHTAKSYLLTTVIMVLFAILFISCAAISLKSRKASPARKKKKAVEAIKPRYAEAFGYVIVAVFVLLYTLHEARIVMIGIVGVLTSIFVFSKNPTQIQLVADKAAVAIGSVADKLFSASDNDE